MSAPRPAPPERPERSSVSTRLRAGPLRPPTGPLQRRVQVGTENVRRRVGSRRKSPHHHGRPGVECLDSYGQKGPQAPAHAMPHHGIAHSATDHESHASHRRLARIGQGRHEVDDQRAARAAQARAQGSSEIARPAEAVPGGEHRRRQADRIGSAHAGHARGPSGRQLAAALAPATGNDGPTSASTHAKAEPMGLGPTAIVGLKGPLAHGDDSKTTDIGTPHNSGHDRPGAGADRPDHFRPAHEGVDPATVRITARNGQTSAGGRRNRTTVLPPSGRPSTPS